MQCNEQKEDRHQRIVDPQQQGLVEDERADPHAERNAEHALVRVAPG